MTLTKHNMQSRNEYPIRKIVGYRTYAGQASFKLECGHAAPISNRDRHNKVTSKKCKQCFEMANVS